MHESPVLDKEPLLSEFIVIPIVDSIMARRKLKLLNLPKKFRDNRMSQEIHQFIGRYNDYLESFRYKCSTCEGLCSRTGAGRWVLQNFNEVYEGKQNYTCSHCLAHFCFARIALAKTGISSLSGASDVKIITAQNVYQVIIVGDVVNVSVTNVMR